MIEKILEKSRNMSFEMVFGSRARTKIIKILALERELNITAIIKKSDLNHATVVKHLTYLKQKDLIQEKRFGRIRIFRYKLENIIAKGIKNLIELIEG
jgi:predicted transcriptional regulator